MTNKMSCRFTETFHDVLLEYPHLLDNITLDTNEQTNIFKEILVARFEIYEVGGETINQFKMFLESNFKIHKLYFQKLINAFDEDINYMDGVIADNETSLISLPNKSTTNEYITNKTKSHSTGGYTLPQLREQYASTLRNIYLEFVEKLSNCFITIFESIY